MDMCALELQELIICVGGLDLLCNEPTCNPPENKLECLQEGGRFSCTHMSDIASDGTVLKSVNSTISCAHNATLGFDVFASSDCQCESAVLTQAGDTTTGVQVCGCELCRQNETQLVSINCSMSVENPFVVGSCESQTCNGGCLLSGENLAEQLTDIRQTGGPTAPTIATVTIAPTQSAEQTTAPSLRPSTLATSSTSPTVTSLAETASPTSSMGGQTTEPSATTVISAPTGFPTTSLQPSDVSQSSLTQPTSAPTSFSTATTPVPTTNSNSSTIGESTSKPTEGPVWGNNTDQPDSSNFTLMPTVPEEPISPEDPEASKWFEHHAVITFGGAFLSTCCLLCMMVALKDDLRGATTRRKKKEDKDQVHMFM